MPWSEATVCSGSPCSFPMYAGFIWLLQVWSLEANDLAAPEVSRCVASSSAPPSTPLPSVHGPTVSHSLTSLVSLLQYHPSLISLFSTSLSLSWESLCMAGLPTSVPVYSCIQKSSQSLAGCDFRFTWSTNVQVSNHHLETPLFMNYEWEVGSDCSE